MSREDIFHYNNSIRGITFQDSKSDETLSYICGFILGDNSDMACIKDQGHNNGLHEPKYSCDDQGAIHPAIWSVQARHGKSYDACNEHLGYLSEILYEYDGPDELRLMPCKKLYND